MQIALPHIAGRLFGRPHAIEPVALRAIMEGGIGRRVLSGEAVGSGKVKKGGRDLRRARLAAIADATQVREAEGLIEYALTPDGVAVVPVAGVLSRRFDWLTAACGWTTYEGLSATLDALAANSGVRAILLDVDTPGGEAAGMLDAADAILNARAAKPVWAVANACAASAGYALAASANKLFVPRLAIVGSIGCVLVHVDQSAQDCASGLKYTAIYSGARKIDGWGHAPLSEEAREVAQADVDHVRDAFAALVGRQGRLSVKQALATEAAIYSDEQAVAAKLADGVMSFDQALAALRDSTKEPTMASRTATLNSSTSAPALAAAPAAAAAADAPAVPQAKKAEDMAPPKPGEKCELCGQTMPDDPGDEDGDDEEQQSRGKKGAHAPAPAAASAAAAAAPQYTVEDAEQTTELCAIARMPALASAFIKAKTPLKAVRADLARRAAEASAQEVSAAAPPADPDEQRKVAAAWDDVVDKINKENAKAGRVR